MSRSLLNRCKPFRSGTRKSTFTATQNRNCYHRPLRHEQLEDRRLLASVFPPTGLVSWWTGDNITGDLTGRNEPSLINGTAYATGMVGQAIDFDGIDDRVQLTDSESLMITDSLTIETWVLIRSAPEVNAGVIFFRGDDRGGLDPYSLSAYSTNEIGFHVGALDDGITLSAAVAFGEFVHVAGTLDDETGMMRVYVNGQLGAEVETTARPFRDLDPDSNPSIGIGNHGGYPTSPHNFPFDGLIDELTIYNRALTAEEIAGIYNAGSDGKSRMVVSSIVPDQGTIIANAPTDFVVDFSFPYDPSSLDPADFAVNGTPASSLGAIDADSVKFVFATSPVTAEGVQTMHMPVGAVTRDGDGLQAAEYQGTFRYDSLTLEVDSTEPQVGHGLVINGVMSGTIAVASSAGMDGVNGGWPIFYGADAVASAKLELAFDEDQIYDSERSHTTEQVAYLAFEEPPVVDFMTTGKVPNVSTSSWSAVTLPNTYSSMVVVATPNYDITLPPMVTRIRNASGNTFEMKLDRADGGTDPVTGIDVYYLVVEEGEYTAAQHGVTMEAFKFNSTVTDSAHSWVGESRAYQNLAGYDRPVVLGQVMTYNDTAFSVFWTSGDDRWSPPSSTTLNIGKHVGEDAVVTRSDETIGYVVLEAGSGTIAGKRFMAAVGADSVAGAEGTPPYTYDLTESTFRVHFNESIDAASIGPDDLILSRGTAVDATVVDADTVDYALLGVPRDDLVIDMVHGAVTDPFGNPILPFSGTYVNISAHEVSIADALAAEATGIHFKGAFVNGFPGTHFNPITFGPDGHLYAAVGTGESYNTIRRFDGETGNLIDTFVAGSRIDGVRDMIFHADEYLYVASSYTDEVLRFDGTTGDFDSVFVTAGSGGIDHPDGLAFGADINNDGYPELYVSASGSDNVVRYDGRTGAPMPTDFIPPRADGLDLPFDLAFHPVQDILYVASAGSNEILKYDALDGTYLGVAASEGLSYPTHVAFGPDDGLLYVSSQRNHRILRFDQNGRYVDDYIPTGDSGLSSPTWLLFGPDGDLYVSALGNDYISRFGKGAGAVATVSVNNASIAPISVEYTTDDRTAKADHDYVATSGSVIIDPGTLFNSIYVPLQDDALIEGNEHFVVDLLRVIGGTIVDNQAAINVVDDDALLFYDSFENGQWNTLWTEDSQDDWFTSTQRATDGTYSAEVGGRAIDATLTTHTTDLTPYGSAELTFDWYIDNALDFGDYLTLDLYDGSSWILDVAKLEGNIDLEDTWHSMAITIDGSYLVNDFQFRFRASMDHPHEHTNLDSVRLVATSLAAPPNTPPLATGESYTVPEDDTLNVTAPGVLGNDTDDDGDSLTAQLVDNVSSGMLTLGSDGAFTYTPVADFNGTDIFTYQAYDGTDYSTTATVTITVDPVNDAPVAGDDSASTEQNTPVVIDLLANDSDIDGDLLSVTAVDLTSTNGGSIADNGAGTVTYTPPLDWTGTDTFGYTVSDGKGGTDTATVTITVTEPNDAPVANDDGYTTAEDTTLTEAAPGVLGNDTDTENDPLTAILVTGPSYGTLTLNANGSFTYDPSLNFNGSDSFTYKANDTLADSNVATVSITVDPVNDAPVATDDSDSTSVNTPATIDVLANDSDVDGDALSVVGVGTPSNGAAGINTDNTITYTPSTDFVGTDSFTYTISDGNGGSDSGTVMIMVQAANMHVGDLDATSTNQGNRWTAIVTIAIHDSAGAPVSGATVTGEWGGDISGTVSCTTADTGICDVQYSGIKKNVGVVTFTVTDVSGSLTYDSTANDDPDGDSDGTMIEVNKPLRAASMSQELVGVPLSSSMVRPVVDAAVAHWAAAGVAPDRLRAARDTDVEIVNLDGSLLGLAYSDWITLDRDAAGHGWSRPWESTTSAGLDLFSAVTHELGHLLGFEHTDAPDHVMAATLPLGTRQMPALGPIDWSLSLMEHDLATWEPVPADSTHEETGVTAGDVYRAAPQIDLLPLALLTTEQVEPSAQLGGDADARVWNDLGDREDELLDEELLTLLADQ